MGFHRRRGGDGGTEVDCRPSLRSASPASSRPARGTTPHPWAWRRGRPIAELIGDDAAACRAALSNRLQEAVDELRALEIRVRKGTDEPALLEVLRRASILQDDVARRVARCQAEVRATFRRAGRELVGVLESDEENGLPESAIDDEDNDQDEDADGAVGVMAEALPEAVIGDEPAPLSNGAGAVPEPGWGEAVEFFTIPTRGIVRAVGATSLICSNFHRVFGRSG